MTAAPAALPSLAGATLQHKDGGGLLAVRPPPLRANKGLPSSTQLDEGFARRRANERKLAAKGSATSNADRGVGVREEALEAVELGAAVKEEFVVKVSRRDDILQVGGTISTSVRCLRGLCSTLSYLATLWMLVQHYKVVGGCCGCCSPLRVFCEKKTS